MNIEEIEIPIKGTKEELNLNIENEKVIFVITYKSKKVNNLTDNYKL